MLKQVDECKGPRAGTIINMGSVLGVLGTSGTPAYVAAKGAVTSMTRAAAMGFAPHKIYCNSILPGCKWRTVCVYTISTTKEIMQLLALP